MQKSLPDIESFDKKVTQLFKEAQHSRSGLFNINRAGKKIGLQDEEIEALHYHLKRSNMVEDVNGPILKFSKYGKMLHNGDINYGYVPI